MLDPAMKVTIFAGAVLFSLGAGAVADDRTTSGTAAPTPAAISTPAQPAISSDTDIRDIFIGQQTLDNLATTMIRLRTLIEAGAGPIHPQSGTNQPSPEVDPAPMDATGKDANPAPKKRRIDAPKKHFEEALAEFVKAQMEAKAKIDSLNESDLQDLKAAMEEISPVWAQFRTAAEGVTDDSKSVDQLTEVRNSARKLFIKVRHIVNERKKPAAEQAGR